MAATCGRDDRYRELLPVLVPPGEEELPATPLCYSTPLGPSMHLGNFCTHLVTPLALDLLHRATLCTTCMPWHTPTHTQTDTSCQTPCMHPFDPPV